jgi:hypothetical protein
MSFTITHRYGSMDRDPPLDQLPTLLAELDDRPEDTEHGSVALTHESEWCLSVARGGYVILEHLENGGERHMRSVQTDDIIRMWQLLASGRIADLEAMAWVLGFE